MTNRRPPSRAGLLCFSFLLAGLFLPRTARADLDPTSIDRLLSGEVITHTFDYEKKSGDYMGLVTYVVVDAPVGAVVGNVMNVDGYDKVFPSLREARIADVEGRDVWIYMRHGNRFGEAEYTIRVRREGGRKIRFWLDDGRDHDIDDLWGFWRADPLDNGRTLLTYGIVSDIGGFLGFFSERIRKQAMTVPKKFRDSLEAKLKRLKKPIAKKPSAEKQATKAAPESPPPPRLSPIERATLRDKLTELLAKDRLALRRANVPPSCSGGCSSSR